MAASDQAPFPPGASPSSGFVPPPEHRFKPGQSGNPSGRPRVDRTFAAAYAELQDMPGETVDEMVAAYRKKRGSKLCGADHQAIALFRASCDPTNARVVSAAAELADRTEGRVAQRVELDANIDVTAAVAAAAKEARSGS